MTARQTHKRKRTCKTSWTRPLPQWLPPCHHPVEVVHAAVGVVMCVPETAAVDVGADVEADVPVAVLMDENLDLSARVAAAVEFKELAKVEGLHLQRRRRYLMPKRSMPSPPLALCIQRRTRLLLCNVRRPPSRQQLRRHRPAPFRRLPRRPRL